MNVVRIPKKSVWRQLSLMLWLVIVTLLPMIGTLAVGEWMRRQFEWQGDPRPLFAVLAVVVVFPLAFLMHFHRGYKIKRRRLAVALDPNDPFNCYKCGYDLRASANQCPECGAAFGPDGLAAFASRAELSNSIKHFVRGGILPVIAWLIALTVIPIVLVKLVHYTEHYYRNGGALAILACLALALDVIGVYLWSTLYMDRLRNRLSLRCPVCANSIVSDQAWVLATGRCKYCRTRLIAADNAACKNSLRLESSLQSD